MELSSLSEAERAAVLKLGITESDLKALDVDTLKDRLKEKLAEELEAKKREAQDKLQSVVDEKIQPRLDELKANIEKEKEELKKDAKKLAAGYLVSTVSLFAATLIAPQAVLVCKTKPSVMVYAGSAAVYVLQEMRNVKILKASELGEIEMVDNLSLDKSKSLKENAQILEGKVDQQVGYLMAYKNTLNHAVDALKSKSKNAKIVSIGFLAASATAAAEQMHFFSGGGACVTSYTPKSVRPSSFDNALYFLQSQILSSAVADDSKKVTVNASLKDSKSADWLGDLDKLGIVGGLAVNVVTYMAGWKTGFLKSVMSSGTSRSIVFAAQAALALTASKLFGDAGSEMQKRLDRIDQLVAQAQTLAKKSINAALPSDSDSRNFQALATKLGVPSDKGINDMTIDEASAYLKKVKEKIQSADDEAKSALKKFQDELELKLKNKIQSTFIPGVLDFLFPTALASSALLPVGFSRIQDINCVEKKTCPSLVFPKSNQKSVNALNQYLGLYEDYYRGVQNKNAKLEENAFMSLDKNQEVIASLRNNFFKNFMEKSRAKNTRFSDYENAKVLEEKNNFAKFYAGLSVKDQAEMDAKLNPANTALELDATKSLKRVSKLNSEEMKVIGRLIERLPAREVKVSSGPDMSFIERSSSEEAEYNFGNTSIHPKDGNLFDIIHIRYLRFMKQNYPDL